MLRGVYCRRSKRGDGWDLFSLFSILPHQDRMTRGDLKWGCARWQMSSHHVHNMFTYREAQSLEQGINQGVKRQKNLSEKCSAVGPAGLTRRVDTTGDHVYLYIIQQFRQATVCNYNQYIYHGVEELWVVRDKSNNPSGEVN